MRLLIICTILLVFVGIFTGVFRFAYGKNKHTNKYVSFFGGLTILSFSFIIYFSYFFNQVKYSAWYPYLHNIGFLAFGWTGAVFMVAIPLFIIGCMRVAVMRYDKKVSTTVGKERRALLKKAAIALPAATFIGSTALAIKSDIELKVNRIQLRYPALPDYVKEVKVGQISDLHLGPYAGIDELAFIFETFKKEGVDRVWITGDLIDEIPMLPALQKLINQWAPQFPQGIDYIYGNHEYYRNLAAIEATLAKTNMRILRNSHIQLAAGEWPVYLAGVDYPFPNTKSKEVIPRFTEQALAGIPENAFIILLAHHPDFIGEAFKRHIPLTLAGHSHGGQINMFNTSLVPMNYDYWRGLYKMKDEPLFGYVSTGAGDWFPLRMNCPREVTIFTFSIGNDTNSHNIYV